MITKMNITHTRTFIKHRLKHTHTHIYSYSTTAGESLVVLERKNTLCTMTLTSKPASAQIIKKSAPCPSCGGRFSFSSARGVDGGDIISTRVAHQFLTIPKINVNYVVLFSCVPSCGSTYNTYIIILLHYTLCVIIRTIPR